VSLFRRGLGATEQVLTQDGRLIGRRSSVHQRIPTEQALRNSVMWGCLRLRADLVSTMPVDVFRKAGDMDVEVPRPPVLVQPGGERVDIIEHLYSSQFDLDRCGNSFGVISEKDGAGLPRRIDLVPYEEVAVQVKDGALKYRVGRKTYEAEEVWHEKQFTTSGLAVGLSPTAYAALTLGNFLSAAQFARDWFDNGSVPSGKLRNKARKIEAGEARKVKERFKDAVANREVFVHGSDWEYEMISVSASESQFLDAIKASGPDVCRFYGVPGDMVDVETSTGNITYANVTQRNLQLLIVNLGPAIVRREAALSRLAGPGRFVKLNTDAILRMDPATREEMLGNMVSKYKTLAPSEARALSNRPPFTPEQVAEFGALFGNPSKTPTAGQPENGATT
jgi:HK97 family phage portal protein